MKTITLILSTLLLSIGINAKELSTSSTFHQYSKPGAAIDMKYTSEKVDVNETSDVNITLTAGIRQGTVSAIITLDKHLNSCHFLPDVVLSLLVKFFLLLFILESRPLFVSRIPT